MSKLDDRVLDIQRDEKGVDPRDYCLIRCLLGLLFEAYCLQKVQLEYGNPEAFSWLPLLLAHPNLGRSLEAHPSTLSFG